MTTALYILGALTFEAMLLILCAAVSAWMAGEDKEAPNRARATGPEQSAQPGHVGG
jgi:hypothetical protein